MCFSMNSLTIGKREIGAMCILSDFVVSTDLGNEGRLPAIWDYIG